MLINFTVILWLILAGLWYLVACFNKSDPVLLCIAAALIAMALNRQEK